MRQRFTILLMLTVIMLIPTGARAAADVGLDELLADGATYAGQTISVVGEFIGDYGFRDDGSAWTQLNGDSYATAPLLEGGGLEGSNVGIGVRAPADLLADLDPPGGYHQRGPLVRASGIWRYHADERSGETYLDVVNIEVIEPGRDLEQEADPAVVFTGAVFVLAALVLAYRSRLRSTG